MAVAGAEGGGGEGGFAGEAPEGDGEVGGGMGHRGRRSMASGRTAAGFRGRAGLAAAFCGWGIPCKNLALGFMRLGPFPSSPGRSKQHWAPSAHR